jgi:hypothetical protein
LHRKQKETTNIVFIPKRTTIGRGKIGFSTIKSDSFREKTTGEKSIMVAKVETIRKKIKQGRKLGFSERARAVNKGLLPSKAKKNVKKA